ncbi:hypothetical protein [Curvivirga aplysinae]|uniref:hypothetical protein n=1 Tax=Curvivirga aplysinae TaxID=2529852 RepID=UPI0012BC01A8|nr:hypothetical protein [Curvivirga aplysinae]MTI10209.1 hypothetical protein [Curvivirga aplysinae]
MSTKQQLIDSAKAYCSNQNISLSTLGKAAVNDGKAITRLIKGADIQSKNMDEICKVIGVEITLQKKSLNLDSSHG